MYNCDRRSLFDCRILPQQGRNGATGPGTPVGTWPLWYQFVRKIVQMKSQ
jgi:hypothetical protein